VSGMKPRVAIIGTGGTISFSGRHGLDLYEYDEFGRLLPIDHVVARFPEIGSDHELVPVPFRCLPSSAVGMGDWLDLLGLVHRVAVDHAPLAGIVIAHGTSTLEETAYFLNLTVKVELPVVMVGAQRPVNALSTDGPLNLLNAVRVAAAREARSLGVLVVLNGEIQAARDVMKQSAYRIDAFRTPDLGILGTVDPDGAVAIYRTPVRRHAPDTEFDVDDAPVLPRVDIVYAHVDAGREAIDAFVGAGSRAIVVAGFSAGDAAPAQRQGLAEARRRGVHVIMSSRSAADRVLDHVSFRRDGLVAADNLSPQKARVLAMLALMVTDESAQIQRLFREY
jgi:L-asparaginase